MDAQPILQTQNLTKRYGDLTAVRGLNLEIRRGEVLGFLGPNGAGKTTAIRMICGLLQPDQGQVLLNGYPLRGRDARGKIGLCPQDVVVWEKLTCLEQLQFIGQMYGLSGADARSRGERLLEVLGLSEQRSKQAHRLSGGMQRRLNLALALVHDPELVVLDEPEAGLDPQSRLKVREYIQSLAQNKTVILTTHNMDEAERLADRVAIIDHGELLVLDTPVRLKARLGEGDVLEVILSQPPGSVEAAVAALAQSFPQVRMTAVNGALAFRALGLVALLPGILKTLAELDIDPAEARLRQNTLEDVFIELTGRKLRE